MGLFSDWSNRTPKKEINKETLPKEGIALFFSVLWREFWEICKLNFLLIIGCLPVITIPVVLTACSRVMVYMLMDEPIETFADFFKTIRQEWKKASLAGLLYFPLLLTCLFSLYFYAFVINNFWLYTLAMLLVALLLIIGFYLFPLLAVVDLDLKSCFKNAFFLTLLMMPKNLLALLVIILLTVMVVLFLPPSITMVLLFYFALVVYITTFCAYGGLKRYVFRKEEENEETDSINL